MNISAVELEMAKRRKYSQYRQGNIPAANFWDSVRDKQEEERVKPVSIDELKKEREDGAKGSYSRILVKPDGSKVLMITTRVGGMETTMSLKISEATDLQIADSKNVEEAVTSPDHSVVEDYKKKHPEDAYHVERQVKAGKRVLASQHADRFPREEMSMAAYQQFIMGIIDRIPFDSSRKGDQQIVKISKGGWEQMKRDPEYEAWILGYLAEDRAVRNPFAGLPGATSSFCIENFGASIEEHHGESFPMEKPGHHSLGKQEQESWWEKRRQRAREYRKEQEKKARIKREVRMEQERELYHQRVWENRQQLEAFLKGDIQEMGQQYQNYYQNYISPELLAAAILACDRRTTKK